MRSYVVLLVLLLFVHSGRSQVIIPNPDQPKELGKTVFGLGLSAGVVSGFGLSFRHHFPSEISYQVVAGIIKVDTKLHYNIGGEAQYDLARGSVTRFFAVAALGYFYSGESGHNDLHGPFRAGIGLGGEWGQIEPLHLSGELLFTYFSDGTVLPLPQVSAHYYFF